MSFMFLRATSFNGDISKWDVSSVTDTSGMFRQARVFNCDLSKWDVSSMTNMDDMFLNAASFNQKLCGASWVRSKASKNDMFDGSSGSISRRVCTSIPDRELIVRVPTSTPFIASTIDRAITCPRCGIFRKSGKVSCCAPRGAWFKNCGGIGSKNADHKWSEGMKACKRKFKVNNM